jgi:aspartyl-tRNA synthetase
MHKLFGGRSFSTYNRLLSANVNSFSLRTHNCGELRLKNEGRNKLNLLYNPFLGEKVQLYGWLTFKRMNRFLVLRDAYGSVQITVPEEKADQFGDKLQKLPYESTLRVTGIVRDRGIDRNPKIETGDVEVVLDHLEVLNKAPDIPKIMSKVEASENTRLINRHIDLRSAKMQGNLRLDFLITNIKCFFRLRSKVMHQMRKCFVEKLGFVEVETPTLAQWTPSGAHEFPVPCAKPFNGYFYSLPQSPQIFKQVLMCGGIDRYFQVS